MKLKEVGLLHGISIPFPTIGRLQWFGEDFDLASDKDGSIAITHKPSGVTRITDKSNCWWVPIEVPGK